MKTCKFCGKSIGAFYSRQSPEEWLPELKETAYFCSVTCQNRFVGSIKAKRSKKHLKELRAKLENSNTIYTKESVADIYATLTRKEKLRMTAIGIIETLVLGDGTISGFYKQIKER